MVLAKSTIETLQKEFAAQNSGKNKFIYIGYSKRIPSPGDEYRITPWRRFRASAELFTS
jgi:hypothetical protein